MIGTGLPPLFQIDRSNRSRLRLTGRDRQSFLQGMVTNDVSALTPGMGTYAFLLDATAHVLSDLRVLCIETSLLLDLEPAQGEFVAATLEKYLIMEKCRIADVSGDLAQITIGGNSAPALMQELFGLPASVATGVEGANAAIAITEGGEPTVIAAVLHLLPVPAFDLYFPAGERASLVARLDAAGLQTSQEAALDTARIEAGVPRFGVDIDAKVLAPETGQESRAIHRRKGCYIGQEIVARIDARGHTNRTFAGFRLAAAPANPGDAVIAEGREVGRITSSALSPTLGVPIALGYLRVEHAASGTPVEIDGKAGTVAALPFVGAE